MAAAYGFGLATAHPHADGSKRAAFLAWVIFLCLNGQDLDATETEVVTVIVALAAGHLTEVALADRLRPHLIPLDD